MLRESLFNICQGYIEGSRFIDFFAGSGAMGIEALSRGAVECVFVDNARLATASIRANLADLKIDNARLLSIDVFKAIERLEAEGARFDILFMDPPYLKGGESEAGLSQRLLERLDRSPIVAEDGVIFVEDSLIACDSEPSLQHLELVKTRKKGKSSLRQYRRMAKSEE
jgi:16S rRNA (guanine966-N2)-methyltransferase